MKVIFTCGGTAGHVNPALALAGYMKEQDPNTEILINMVPERFFFDLVMRIISSFMALCAFLYIVLKVIAGRKANV